MQLETASSTPPGTSRTAAFALLWATIAVGSVAFTFVTVALRELSPLSLATGRVVSSAALFTFVVVRSPGRRHRIRPEDRWKVFACGFGGSAVFHVLFNLGQQRVSVAIAAVIMSTYPVMTSVGEVLFLGHRLRPLQVVGLVVSLGGSAAIAFGGSLGGGSAPVVGALLIAGSTATWAAVTVITRGLGDRYDAWWLNTPGTVAGAAVMLLVDATRLDEFGHLSVKGWLLVIWLGTASSAFIYYAMARAMTVVSATTATSLSTVVTPTSVLVAWVVLGDPPSWREVVGGAVVLAGVMLVVRSRDGASDDGATAVPPLGDAPA